MNRKHVSSHSNFTRKHGAYTNTSAKDPPKQVTPSYLLQMGSQIRNRFGLKREGGKERVRGREGDLHITFVAV